MSDFDTLDKSVREQINEVKSEFRETQRSVDDRLDNLEKQTSLYLEQSIMMQKQQTEVNSILCSTLSKLDKTVDAVKMSLEDMHEQMCEIKKKTDSIDEISDKVKKNEELHTIDMRKSEHEAVSKEMTKKADEKWMKPTAIVAGGGGLVLILIKLIEFLPQILPMILK